jgi:hypothetical protein
MNHESDHRLECVVCDSAKHLAQLASQPRDDQTRKREEDYPLVLLEQEFLLPWLLPLTPTPMPTPIDKPGATRCLVFDDCATHPCCK